MLRRPFGMLLVIGVVSFGCGGASAPPPPAESPDTFSLGEAPTAKAAGSPAPQAAPASKGKYAWEAPPGPIAGKWKTTCAFTADMVIEISVSGKTATGKIVELGQGGKRHYEKGEEILNLEANDFGHWVGKLRWKSLAGMDRRDPIHMVATPESLDATMTTDECYKGMPRVH